ncbi:hypothetical protein DM02DRAFT_660216 [Periconia macrospinosa]|uniref:Zn(2)-C6 fungal-type domain-containing protein n=1 Tax=Periconia macrospinosa TaxID=97972 RepID=A0A2V1DBE1_9PLEO|nr:hypothetical protein DM02DRAFT_660216 [Periconia macrospinosa]
MATIVPSSSAANPTNPAAMTLTHDSVPPTPTPTVAPLNLDTLIQSLPACQRCRECRRGCDTTLPKCRQCHKAGVDCVYRDHGRAEFVSRSYIADLVDHVKRRYAQSGNPTPPASGDTPQEPLSATSARTESMDSVIPDPNRHYEHYFAWTSETDTYRYLGAESCLVKSPRLHPVSYHNPFGDDDDDWQISWSQSPAKSFELVEVFLDSIQPLYPVLDPDAPYLARDPPSEMSPVELFSLNMVYSIACHVMPGTARRRNPRHQWNPNGKLSYHMANSIKYRTMATKFHETAMEYLEASTSDSNMDTLRAVLLLAINSLFDPKTGNIGQQTALAARLALTLESRCELQEMTSKDAWMLRNMHSTIFCIENELATTLDRPATFPEPAYELCFDPNRPSDYLCSLYRLQNRYRKGDAVVRRTLKNSLPLLDEKSVLPPSLRLNLHQTHYLLNPCWHTAWYILESVVSTGSIHIFLTPHWVYRAGTSLIENMSEIFPGNLIQLYSNALVVLELSSWKWGASAATLSASLSETMQRMKAQTQPEWDGTLQSYDVRI